VVKLKIAVFIKQVPDTDEVRMDEKTGTLIREGVGTVINPLDQNALELALSLRAEKGASVTVLSMGPPQAEIALREALALGADEGVLVCDRLFAGSDTWATARTLSAAASATGPYDLFLAGAKATDGETGQVGPEAAAMMGLPFLSNVCGLEAGEGGLVARRSVEEGTERARLPFPCLLTVVHEINEPSMPTLAGKMRARRAAIRVLAAADLGLDPAECGLSGSPTRVVRIAFPKVTRSGERYAGSELDRGIDRVVDRLDAMGLLGPRSERETPRAKDPAGVAPLPPMEELPWTEEAPGMPPGGVLVAGECRGGTLHPSTLELAGKARELADARGGFVTVTLPCDTLGDDPARCIRHGADRVILVRHPGLRLFNPDVESRLLANLIRRFCPEIVLAAATTSGRTVLPAVAALVDTGLTADCTGLSIDPESGDLLQTRPAIGGNVLATIRTPSRRPQMATVRPRTFRLLQEDPSRQGAVLHLTPPEAFMASPVEPLGAETFEAEIAPIQDAEVVVSGGKGLKRPDAFCLVEELAGVLDGAVGASRPTVEAKWIGYPHQVGLSGKVVTPRVYIAVGISGAIQHLAGMQTSEFVVAVNRDPEAGIFRVADIGLVGDLFDIVPRLASALAARKEARP
jgi:electron transfer flavoprotein alpha subunit